MSTTLTDFVKINGIPAASPLSVLNGRTGVRIERGGSRFGTFRLVLSQPISAEDVRLAEVASLADLTEDAEGSEVEILDTCLENAEPAEPGREVPPSLALAAHTEIIRMARQGTSEMWALAKAHFSPMQLRHLIPESVVTDADARAWAHARAASTGFGF